MVEAQSRMEFGVDAKQFIEEARQDDLRRAKRIEQKLKEGERLPCRNKPKLRRLKSGYTSAGRCCDKCKWKWRGHPGC